MSDQALGSSAKYAVPFRVKTVTFDAPWEWLSSGWADLWKKPTISLMFGAAVSAAAFCLLYGLFQFGWQSLILVLAGGFMLVGPLLAVGLYDMSRRYQLGEPVTMASATTAAFHARGQLIFLGLILAFVFLAWIRIAVLLFMLFIGTSGLPPPSEFIPTLLFTPHGLGLLVVGTAVGAALAALVFAISVVSVPLVLVHRADAIQAVVTSVRAVLENWKVMVFWAVLIAGFVTVGIATLFIGLVFVFPLIGHASWYAFRDLVEAKIGPETV